MFRGGRSSFGSATLVTCGRLEGFRSLRTSLRRTALSETAIETEATEAARDESVAQGGNLAFSGLEGFEHRKGLAARLGSTEVAGEWFRNRYDLGTANRKSSEEKPVRVGSRERAADQSDDSVLILDQPERARVTEKELNAT